MNTSLITGDFNATNYKKDIERDFLNLTKYEKLIRLDIKSFYETIYTHMLFDNIDKKGINNLESFFTNLNQGRTGGIIKGPYTSLVLVEELLIHIMNDFQKQLDNLNIKIHFEFFSDDIFLFLNEEDKVISIGVLIDILNKYKLQLNHDKLIEHDYVSYSKENVIDKYWNIIIRDQEEHENKELERHYFNFINQLIYRKSKLKRREDEAILINGFFKSEYFINIDVSHYQYVPSNTHQLLYLYREHPESLLYSINKFKFIKKFAKNSYDSLMSYFYNSLHKPYQEEQLYYFYALYSLHNDSVPKFQSEVFEKILNSNNQILISYFVMRGNYDERIDKLLNEKEEKWLLNYHLILRKHLIEKNDNFEYLIKKYLLPEKSKGISKTNYLNFYKKAIENKITIINMTPHKAINLYLYYKKKEFEQDV